MISDNIKNQRTKKGLTQKDLADRLHVTPQAISRWEKGDVEPSFHIQTIIRITLTETESFIAITEPILKSYNIVERARFGKISAVARSSETCRF